MHPYQHEEVIEWCGLMTRSFNSVVVPDLGCDALVPDILTPEQQTMAIYNHRDAILSHRYEDEPRFCLFNKAAQELFGYSWGEAIGMPSRLSAQSDVQEDRERLLKQADQKGYVPNYSGVRIRKTGELFEVNNVILWNVTNTQNKKVGQAAMIKDWTYL